MFHGHIDRMVSGLNYKLDHKNISSRVMLPWLWREYLRKYTFRIVVAVLFVTIQGSLLGLLSFMVGPMFDDVLLKGSHSALFLLGLLVFGIFCTRGVTGFIHRLIMVWVGERVKLQLQDDLMRHVLTLDTMFFEANPPGNLIARILDDSQAIKSLWSNLISPAARDILSIVSLLVVLVYIDWLWTIVTCAGIPLLVGPIYLLQKQVRRQSLNERTAVADTVIRLDEIFHGIHAIKLNIQEVIQTGRFLEAALRLRRATIRVAASNAGVPFMVDLVAGIGFMGMLLLGGSEVISGEKTVGQFMSFFTATVLLFDPLRRLGALFTTWQNIKVSMERIHVMLDVKPSILAPAKPVKTPPDIASGDIEFRNVTFNFDSLPVFDNLSFVAKAGKMTALVGPSGAGKTTVLNLLTRILDPQAGRILVGGTDISTLDLVTLRNMYAVVAQDSGIFDETIRHNILLGNPGASEEELNAAIEASHVRQFSDTLKHGLEQPCGPRGSNLSGGQRQRIAIARALLRNAPVLLLDEPTAALDAKSEALVQSAIDALETDRTIIVIAHRMATVRNSDHILVLDEGGITEQGNHDSLLQNNGLYAAYYNQQIRMND